MQFNGINLAAIFSGITLAGIEMTLSLIVLITALIYNILKIRNVYKDRSKE